MRFVQYFAIFTFVLAFTFVQAEDKTQDKPFFKRNEIDSEVDHIAKLAKKHVHSGWNQVQERDMPTLTVNRVTKRVTGGDEYNYNPSQSKGTGL